MMKVFLVDDEIAIRENLRNSFPWEEKGFQLVGEAPDGEMALPMIRDLDVDILLTDIRMPNEAVRRGAADDAVGGADHPVRLRRL